MARDGFSPLIEERLTPHLYLDTRNVSKAAAARFNGGFRAW
jgi:hypothetical protein